MLALDQVREISGCLHPRCVLCGPQNPWSLRLQFLPGEDGSVQTIFRGHERLQGYEGILHGGVIAALLDAAMTHCLFYHGVHVVTAALDIRYLEAVPLEVPLVVKARPVSMRPTLYRLQAEVEWEGRVLASAEARFMPPRKGSRGSASAGYDLPRQAPATRPGPQSATIGPGREASRGGSHA